MIEIHSHIIPGVDDGSKSLDKSLEMIKICKDTGINTIITTPHYLRGTFNNDFNFVKEEVNKLQEEVNKNSLDVKILPGQEIYLDNKTLADLKSGYIKGLNDGKYILLELKPDTLPKETLDILYEIKILGMKPIIAHPERYLYFFKDKELINKFIKEEIFFQLNAGSVLGKFGDKAEKLSREFIENGVCHFLASDCHGVKHRSPCLMEGLKKIGEINKVQEEKIRENLLNLVNDEDIKYEGTVFKKKRGIFSLFKR